MILYSLSTMLAQCSQLAIWQRLRTMPPQMDAMVTQGFVAFALSRLAFVPALGIYSTSTSSVWGGGPSDDASPSTSASASSRHRHGKPNKWYGAAVFSHGTTNMMNDFYLFALPLSSAFGYRRATRPLVEKVLTVYIRIGYVFLCPLPCPPSSLTLIRSCWD